MSNETTYHKRVRQAYKAERAKNLPACTALQSAKWEAKYGHGSAKRHMMPHVGDTETIEYANGWTVEIKVEHDESHEPPWENDSNCGVVTDWQSRDDTLEEWELDSARWNYRYYDWRATLPLAIRDGWDAPPYCTGTRHEQAMRAMKSDYEFIRRWCNDQWHYVGLIVTLKDENGDEIESDSCWGYESECKDYICSEARSWLAYMLREARKKQRESRRQGRIANRFHDAMECGL